MNKAELTDEILYKEIPVVYEDHINEITDHVDYDGDVSLDLENKLSIIRKRISDNQKGQKAWISVWKIAAAFLITVLGIFAVSITVKAVRDKFFSKTEEVFDGYVDIRYKVEEDPGEMEKIYPSYIPDGYELIEEKGNAIGMGVRYQDQDGDYIYWGQCLVVNGLVSSLDTEYMNLVTVQIGGDVLYIQEYESGVKSCYMEHEKYIFDLDSNNLDVNEIEKIYRSIDQ